MAKSPRFNLKEPKSSSPTLIYLFFSYNSKRLKYSTGQSILPKFWNESKQRAKESSQFPQYPELNTFLNNLEHETLNIYRSYLNKNKIPSLNEMRKELDVSMNRKQPFSNTSLFEFIGHLINERSKMPKYSKNSIKVYKNTFNHLQNYSEVKRRKLEFEDIDLDFFADFQNYLYSPPNLFSQNHANKIIATFKTFLNEATERGYNKNMAYKSRSFTIPKNQVENIYLTIDELNTLYHLDLSENERLERVRDLFLIGAFTGLRFSDFTNIKPENIKTVEGVEVIQMVTIKTKEPVTIPLHPITKAILKKHKNNMPKALSNQKMNSYLKELAKMAGFMESILLTKSKAGKRYEKKFEKWELVTTHTARRSFATNAFKAGIPALSIMKITGHTTEQSFMKYIKISKEENAILMAKNSFFQTSPMKAI